MDQMFFFLFACYDLDKTNDGRIYVCIFHSNECETSNPHTHHSTDIPWPGRWEEIQRNYVEHAIHTDFV